MVFIVCPPNNFYGSSPHKNCKRSRVGLNLNSNYLDPIWNSLSFQLGVTLRCESQVSKTTVRTYQGKLTYVPGFWNGMWVCEAQHRGPSNIVSAAYLRHQAQPLWVGDKVDQIPQQADIGSIDHSPHHHTPALPPDIYYWWSVDCRRLSSAPSLAGHVESHGTTLSLTPTALWL